MSRTDASHRLLEANSLIADLRRPTFCAHDWVNNAKLRLRRSARRLAGRRCHHQQGCRSGHVIAALPDLQMIAVSATGTNNVDLDACRAQGIVLSNIRGYAVHTVPEARAGDDAGAVAQSLCLARDDYRPVAGSRPKQFCLFDHPIRDLHGATLGLIGSGLGNGVARLAEAFGMRVLRAEREGVPVRSGYIAFEGAGRRRCSQHPLSPDRADAASDRRRPGCKAMKSSALLINTAVAALSMNRRWRAPCAKAGSPVPVSTC